MYELVNLKNTLIHYYFINFVRFYWVLLYMKQVFNRRPLLDPLFQYIPSFCCTVNLFVGFFVSMLCAIFSHHVSDKCNRQIYRINLMCLSMKNFTANSVKLKK